MSRILFFMLVLGCFSSSVFAQDTKQIFLKNVFIDDVLVVSGETSAARQAKIILWGVQPVTPEETLVSKLKLENLIDDQPVNCTIKQWKTSVLALAQCLGVGEKDLALAMIEQGYAMADRHAVKGTVFESIYKDAETSARNRGAGEWRDLIPKMSRGSLVESNNNTPFKLTEDVAYFVIGAMILSPIIGMLIVGMAIYGGFRRLISLQKYQIAVAGKKDRTMRAREKFIVSASLEGEMNTNRAKLDAFIIIYEELLRNLRDPLKDHKYKKGGDIIHAKPALSRNVYDSNIDKLDVLGQSIVTDLAHFYTMIEPNPDYKTIESDAPIEDVIDFVSDIVRDAEAMLVPMNDIDAALNVIVRDKRASTSNSIR